MSQNVFFTADTHLASPNIARYNNRPFECMTEMEEIIIQRTNELVRPGDRIYHLGDVAWSTYDWNLYLARLSSREYHQIIGNHEPKGVQKKYPAVRTWADLRTIKIGSDSITMCHYALKSWPKKANGMYSLFGHSHGKLKGEGRSRDVGVDTSNFYPLAWEDIKAELDKIDFEN